MKFSDSLLQANSLSTYGYFLILVNRKPEALKALEQSAAMFQKIEADGVFTYDKYRTTIIYADLLFSLGQHDAAVKLVSSAESTLNELQLDHTGVYANCKFTLGIYRLCLHDAAAADDLVCAFRILIDLYGADSDIVKLRKAEAKQYIKQTGFDLTQSASLLQLLEK